MMGSSGDDCHPSGKFIAHVDQEHSEVGTKSVALSGKEDRMVKISRILLGAVGPLMLAACTQTAGGPPVGMSAAHLRLGRFVLRERRIPPQGLKGCFPR